MMLSYIKILFLLFFVFNACDANKPAANAETVKDTSTVETEINQAVRNIETGASQMDQYLPIIRGKKIALVVNQTSTIGRVHLVDTLLASDIDILKIFAPEHGFRGEADAGEKIKDGKDEKTGIPLISLYGNNKKPNKEMLDGIDIILFDIQDVGVRFYTYISTMTYVMEACAENGLDFLVLDRPNPNGHYVDGPILKSAFKSFIGLHPVPVVHGMTVGEYAKMLNGEGWLSEGLQCKLRVIPCKNYQHDMVYELPVRPSPNLPNMRAIYLYPSLCFFEGTTVNVGRGTDKQFQIYGHPAYKGGEYTYTPKSGPGAKFPKFEGETCLGYDLSDLDPEDIRKEARLNLGYLINFYKSFPSGEAFFLQNNFFDKLAGTDELRFQILSGMDEEMIRKTWQKELAEYKIIRKKYLLY